MTEILSLIYFIGLIMTGVAVGSYTGAAALGFVIIGSGAVVYAGAMGMALYLQRKS